MDWEARIRRSFETEQVPEPEVIEELAQHAEAIHERARSRGSSVDEADELVSVLIDQWKAEAASLRHRARRSPSVIPPAAEPTTRTLGLAHDLRYAFRLLRRQPRFSLLVVLTVALGIGTTTALFTVVHGVLLKPLPWPDGERLVVLKERRGGNLPRFGSFSNTAYLAWRDQPQTIDEIGAWAPRTVTLTGTGNPERIRAMAVTASLLRATGARAIKGTLFDDRDESSPVVVISESLWRTRFGADEALVGKSIQLDGESRTVVGVLPDTLGYPDRLVRAWVPFKVPLPTGNLLSMFEAVAKLKPGATVEQAAAEATSRGRYAAGTGLTTTAIFGGDGPIEVSATSLANSLTAEVRRPLFVLLAAVVLLLVISVTNIASLQLARASGRRRELAIRASIGASSQRLTRQLIAENLLTGLLGGVAGIALAWALLQAAPSILPSDFPRATDIRIGGTPLLFAAGLTIATSIAFGLVLVFRVRRLNLVSALTEDGVSPVGGSGRSGIARTRSMIVAGQIALACLLLVAALLLGRSFERLLHADRGYDPARVVTARLSLPSPAYNPFRRSDVLGGIVSRLNSVPGVSAASFSTELPLTPGGSTSAFTLPSRDPATPAVQVQASPRIVSPGYFSALGLRVMSGRALTDDDTAAAEPVVVVNETFQRRYLGNDAIGSKLPMALWGQNQDGDATIVGIVQDVHYIGTTSTLAELYFSHKQLKVGVRPTTAALLVRTDTDPAAIAPLIRSAVNQADPSLVAESIMTLEDRLLATSLARPRLYAVLVGSFALIALIVTGVGLFSVLSFTVSLRTRELGVRAALGARQSELVRLVLAQGVLVAVIGLALGLLVSVWAARFLETVLYGVAATDLTTYLVVPLILFVVVLIASLAPAWRAAKLDPVKALRA